MERSENPSLPSRVRAACRWVAEVARTVRIAGDPGAYARLLLDEEGEAASEPEWDEQTHFRGGEEETAAFVITLDAINFGSGYFPHLHKRPSRSGYFTVALALKERFERSGPFSASELQALTPDAVAKIFDQPPGDPVRDELMSHFCTALRDLGEFLESRHRRSFAALVRSADGSAPRLAAELTAMTYFRDVARYRGRDVPLYKRAQIAPSDLSLALRGQGLGALSGLDELTIFADNLVPHVLRLDGVLEYAPALVGRLESGERLPPGSAEEVEIRAVALHAVELMVDELRAVGVEADARRLDLLLWNRGQAQRYRGGSKHRTRTVYY